MDYTQIIKDRLNRVISNPETKDLVFNDYTFTYSALGLPRAEAQALAKKVFSYISESKTLKETEDKIRAVFESTCVGKSNIFDLIRFGMQERVDKIFIQLKPYLSGIKGKVFDYGMGAGQVTQKLKDELGLDIEGGDVRDFRAPECTVPFVLLTSASDNQGHIVNVPDKYYEAAVVTNVIHHEKINKNILKELDRIVKRKLVIIETVPVGNTAEEIRIDHERTFANDASWNRFFTYADIPVPGTYETPQDWIRRFESYGWKTAHSEDLGFDHKTIHDVHHLLVFER